MYSLDYFSYFGTFQVIPRSVVWENTTIDRLTNIDRYIPLLSNFNSVA